MVRFGHAVALVTAACMLAGCQTIFGSDRGMGAAAEQDFEQQAAREAAEQLKLGRAHLDRRKYGAAIAAFRSARLDPAHAATAQNGLAVAYAQLGRPDLAERYFRLAMLE